METTKNKPLASPKEDTLVGNGMSKRLSLIHISEPTRPY